MKKILLALTLLILATTCYSQTPVRPTPSQEAPTKGTREYYLQRSKTKQIKGWIFTPVGVGLIGLGAATAWAETVNSITTLGQNESNGSMAGFMIVGGLVSVIGGTISFVSAGHNRRKARSMAVGYEQVPLPQQKAFQTKAVPTVGLQVTF